MKIRAIRTHPRLLALTAAVMLLVGAGAAYAGVSAQARAGESRGAVANAVASQLGITRQQLRSDLAGGQTLAQLAAANGSSANGLEQAILAAAQSRLDQAVNAGLLTNQKEQAVLSRLGARLGTLVNVKHPGAHVAVALRLRLAVVRLSARYLGLTPQQLRSEIGSGQTLAQATVASGKSISGLEEAVQSALKTRLDQAVTKGELSAQQEQTLLGVMQTRLAAALAG